MRKWFQSQESSEELLEGLPEPHLHFRGAKALRGHAAGDLCLGDPLKSQTFRFEGIAAAAGEGDGTKKTIDF